MNKSILFCEGDGCPFKHDCKCYRKKDGSDTDDVMYFIDVPYDLETNSCMFRWRKN